MGMRINGAWKGRPVTTSALTATGPVNLKNGTAFFVPQMPTASLPSAADSEGMLVWDTTQSELTVAIDGTWNALDIRGC